MIMSALSNRQFAHDANARGASRRLDTHEAAPADGVYVSTPGHERRIKGRANARDVARHALTLRGKQGYQGGWRQDGETYLDHSVRTHTPAVAATLGRQWKQKSIYDARHDSYIDPNGPVDYDKSRVRR